MEFIYILKCHFHRDPVTLTGEIDHIMNRLFGTVHVFDKADDSLRLMECDFFRFFFSLIFKNDRKLRIQISGLMQTTLYFIFLETCFIEDSIVRQKVNGGTGLPCLTYDGKQTVYQIQNGIPPFIAVFVNTATGLDSYCQSCRQSIYYRGTYAVQTAAGLICGIVEFTAGMQSRKYQTLRADPFFVHTHGNTTTVIFHGCGAVGFQCHLYRITISGQMLVHRVINDLVDQMIQSLGGDAADIHSGSFSYRFQTFQNGNT